MRSLVSAGYSGTPLAQKLSLKPGLRAWFDAMPASVLAQIGDRGVERMPAPTAPIDAAHVFVTDRTTLSAKVAELRPLLAPNGFLWISWPKQAAARKLGVPTDITEDVIRDVALPTGLVDVKVCAIDTIWSGLKLMIRKELR